MMIRYSIVLGVFLIFSVPLNTLAADEGVDEDESERCINARAVRRTQVVNDNTVIFYMQGSKIYINNLTRTCKGLSRDGRFSYATYTRSLCALDRINVLKESGGGLYEGRACKLGRFQFATAQDIEDFYEELHRIPQGKKLEPPPVEDVISDDAAEDDPQ